jgi:hypothetical protein
MGKKHSSLDVPPPESDPEITGSFKRTFNSWLLSRRRMKLAARRRRNRKSSVAAVGTVAVAIVGYNIDWSAVSRIITGG